MATLDTHQPAGWWVFSILHQHAFPRIGTLVD
jgi:hypothetical protein